jgi:hypothetical protein
MHPCCMRQASSDGMVAVERIRLSCMGTGREGTHGDGTMSQERTAEFIIDGNNRWFGDARLGTFTVYVDGMKVGSVAPG